MREIGFSFLVECLIFYFCHEYVEALIGPGVSPAREGEFKNVVAVMRVGNNDDPNLAENIRCAGVLVTRLHVLTSEHCVNGMGINSMYVLVGSVDLRKAKPFFIEWWITYNLWAISVGKALDVNKNDIAVLKLRVKVPQRIKPAQPLRDRNQHLDGLQVYAMGWGKLSNGQHPSIMHKATLRIISKTDCQNKANLLLGRPIAIHDRYLCTFNDPWTLINDGDSGGPILFGNVIIGITKGTTPETNNNDPRKANLHVSALYYKEFIEYNMKLTHSIQ